MLLALSDVVRTFCLQKSALVFITLCVVYKRIFAVVGVSELNSSSRMYDILSIFFQMPIVLNLHCRNYFYIHFTVYCCVVIRFLEQTLKPGMIVIVFLHCTYYGHG